MPTEMGTSNKTQVILLSALMVFAASTFLSSCESRKQPQGGAQSAAPQPSDNVPSGAKQEEPFPASPAENPTPPQELTEKTLNTPKGVGKAKLVLETRDNADTVKVVVLGGEGTSYKYAWTKNGEPAGSGDSISGFKRGDKIAVTITPFDDKAAGEPKTLGIEIRNSVPRIVESKQLGFDGKVLTYQVKAIDPDGDDVAYSLANAPQGMTIDKSTGIITWPVGKDVSGKFPVKVKISDGHGGEVLCELTADISEAKPQEKPK